MDLQQTITVKKAANVDGIYVVHGISGYEEREKILNEMLGNQLKLNFTFMTESHEPSVNETLIRRYFPANIRELLRKGPLYCTLVHILCYEEILRNDNDFAIIFENDVCFLGDFNKKIKNILAEARELSPGFMISLENSTLEFPSIRKTQKGRYLYPAQAGRCAGAYLVDKQAVVNIMKDLQQNKCHEVIDWWHNALIKRGVFKMYWAHPPLTEQGSFNGTMPSSISSKSDTIIRKIKWLAHKSYKMYILRLFR